MDTLKLLKQVWEDRPFNPGEWVTNFIERIFAAWSAEHYAKIQLRKELAGALRREIEKRVR